MLRDAETPPSCSPPLCWVPLNYFRLILCSCSRSIFPISYFQVSSIVCRDLLFLLQLRSLPPPVSPVAHPPHHLLSHSTFYSVISSTSSEHRRSESSPWNSPLPPSLFPSPFLAAALASPWSPWSPLSILPLLCRCREPYLRRALMLEHHHAVVPRHLPPLCHLSIVHTYQPHHCLRGSPNPKPYHVDWVHHGSSHWRVDPPCQYTIS